MLFEQNFNGKRKFQKLYVEHDFNTKNQMPSICYGAEADSLCYPEILFFTFLFHFCLVEKSIVCLCEIILGLVTTFLTFLLSV